MPTTNAQLPNIVYYNDDHSQSPKCTGQLMELVKVTYTMTSTWRGLTEELEQGAEYLVFHVDMITKSMHSTPAKFIEAVTTMTKFIPGSKSVKISVLITPTTPVSMVRSLQQAGIQGIGLDLNYFPVEEVATAVNAHIGNIPYWPKHIIDQLPDPEQKPLNVYLRGNWEEYQLTFNLEKFKKALSMDLAICRNWNDLDEALSRNPHQLVFHITELERLSVTISEIALMLKTRLKIHGMDIPIAVGINADTTISQIKELKRSGIHSIIPNASDWGVQETITALHSIRDRVPHWPKHILDQLPGSVKRKIKVAKRGDINLTARQEQICNLIKERGLSNKHIAKLLNIGESTVKLHVGCILKKYGVKNRTQLAVFSRERH